MDEKILNIASFVQEAQLAISSAKNTQELELLRVKYLGKNGSLSAALKQLGKITDLTQRKQFGEGLNRAKTTLQELIESSKVGLTQGATPTSSIDFTLAGRGQNLGSLHPVTLVRARIEQIFCHLGFKVAHGPEIEDDFHNFTALNIPEHHPARADHDTFYFGDGYLLRTHTSPVQIRELSNSTPPVRLIAPGRVYRCDYDVTHTPMFHQIEGLLVDENISFAHLKALLSEFIRVFFARDNLQTRFRTSFFPFTEPSAEMDVSCVVCTKSNRDSCRICSGTGWLEVLGCGVIHPNVLINCNVDPEKYSGFAFGAGLDRLAMLFYHIPDLRQMFENDLRFLRQFSC